MKRKMISGFLILFLLNACTKSGGGGGGTTNSAKPKISMSDAAMPEGNAGTTNFEFTAYLSNATSQTVTFTYSLLDGTAKAGEDFVAATNQTVTFGPNETTKKIIVSIITDDLKESDETFQLQITAATNATYSTTPVTGTIVNDDTKININYTGYDAPTSYPGYALAWSDEFNGTSLNQNFWSFQNGNGCPNLCGWGNSELESYSENNLFFQDGKMIIEARKEGSSYTSSKIVSTGKKSFKFGRIDIRAILPKGKGIWPALWLMPESSVYGGWPKSGEIDLMELLGQEPNKVYGTLHYSVGTGSNHAQLGSNFTLPTGSFSDEFHVFSLIWKQDQIQFLVDGNVYNTIAKASFGSNNYPFNENFYFIFNVAVGGQWPGNPDATTTFPQQMVVDYVRVYQ